MPRRSNCGGIRAGCCLSRASRAAYSAPDDHVRAETNTVPIPVAGGATSSLPASAPRLRAPPVPPPGARQAMSSPAERLFTTWFTSSADGHGHAVTDEEAHRSYRTGTDPSAVCGHTVTPTPLITPPGPRCPRCKRYLLAHTPTTNLNPRAHLPRPRRPSWLRRLLSLKPPA